MGIWGTIAKGIVGALPVVGPIIEGGIEAATAAKASKQQVAGGQRAMDIQDRIYQQQQNLLSPYYNTGTAAFTTLGGLLGLPSGGGGGGMQTAHMGTLGSAMPYGPLPNDTQKGALTDPNVQPDASYNAQGQWIGNQPQAVRATMNSTSSYGSPQQFGSGPGAMTMIRMQAPTGEIEVVPADQVSHYTQQGAKVLGSA